MENDTAIAPSQVNRAALQELNENDQVQEMFAGANITGGSFQFIEQINNPMKIYDLADQQMSSPPYMITIAPMECR